MPRLPSPFEGGDVLRLDKWLKVARVIKRRTIAHDAAETGRVTLNGKPAKPASEVRVGDEMVVDIGGRETALRVLMVPDRPVPRGSDELYEVLWVRQKGPGTIE